MTRADSSAAEKARASGNEFYRAGQLAKASKAYSLAASLAPHDAAPLSNLSAVSYEMGDYAGAISHIKRALPLLPTLGIDDKAKKDKLNARLAKCCLFLRDFDSAKEAIAAISNQNIGAELSESLELMTSLQSAAPGDPTLRKQVLDHVPPFKSWLAQVAEYYPIGHDQAEPFKELVGMDKTGKKLHNVSLFFAGSGDARNVYSAISSMAAREEKPRRAFGNLHITMLDLKPAAMAKALILFNMMYQIHQETDKSSTHQTDGFLVMAYTFACQIIPPFVQAKLQSNIATLIKRLEKTEEPLPFVYLSERDASAVVRVLRQWQQPWPGISKPSHVRKIVRRSNLPKPPGQGLPFGGKEQQNGPANKDFEKFTALFPSDATARQWEPSLAETLAEYRTTGQSDKLSRQINQTWAVNNTMIDYDFADVGLKTGDPEPPYLEFDALEAVDAMDFLATERKRNKSQRSSPIEHLSDIFRVHAISTMKMNSHNRLTVEMIVGEMTDVMERIRYNALDHRQNGSPDSGDTGRLDPTKFPQTYDYVHMSNIPDYIGGHLTTFLTTRPLLKDESTSSIRFNNLLNPPEFKNHAAFQSEYLLMHDVQQIRNHFAFNRRVGADISGDPMLNSMLGGMMSAFAFEGDMTWDSVPKSPMSYQNLLPRAAFEKWMYGHLLKICLPYPRPTISGAPVYAPLNLSTLIRLIIAMFEAGYPAHWLSKILSQICAGVVTTAARPPTRRVTDSAAVDAVHPPQEFSVRPWADEFSTLLSIWCGLLPFGIESPAGGLVPLTGIRKYSISFPPFRAENERLPHFMLLFWNYDLGYTLKPPTDILDVLSGKGDETGTHVAPRVLLDKAIVCVTAFKFLADTRTAVFSMRADRMEKMKAGKWRAFIWRTDAWCAVTDGVDVSLELVTGDNWAGLLSAT